MSQYLMILHDSTTAMAAISPAEMQAIVERYMRWSAKLGEAGHLRGGNKLRDGSGRHLSGFGGKMVIRDGPFTEAKEIIGGYFLIEAESYEQAVALSADCPHLELGGRIELREVEPT